MKSIKLMTAILMACCFSVTAFAQQAKKESFKVWGNCEMCKSKIEKASKNAGASYAVWDVDSKQLTVKYDATSSSAAKIQQAIALAGYDTPTDKATTEAYNKLHSCCKYDREVENKSCCGNDKCGKEANCCANMASCKDKECCTNTNDGNKMSCCKEGKCNKEGHSGKDCCKKS